MKLRRRAVDVRAAVRNAKKIVSARYCYTHEEGIRKGIYPPPPLDFKYNCEKFVFYYCFQYFIDILLKV